MNSVLSARTAVHAGADEREVRLRVRNLSKSYGEGSAAVEVIGDLSFDVEAGAVVSIVGPSGVGKTTLLRCLSGLQPYSGGEVRLDDELVTTPPRNLAVVFQEYTRSLMPWLTVNANVRMPLKRSGLSRRDVAARVDEALQAVGLAGAESKYPWQLSGGMQQRVAIARAIAYRPEVLVMDEPFASVDAQTRFELEDLCLRVRDQFGMTILLVTHDIDEAVYLSDRIVVVGKKPAVVTEMIDVDFPEPRSQLTTRATKQFAELRSHVLALIRDAH